jgi:hypothetical protein
MAIYICIYAPIIWYHAIFFDSYICLLQIYYLRSFCIANTCVHSGLISFIYLRDYTTNDLFRKYVSFIFYSVPILNNFLVRSQHVLCYSVLSCWMLPMTRHVRKFNSAPGCVCSLYQKIIFWVVKKFWQKILHVHQHNICAFVKFHEKSIFFVVYVKKRKFIL